jgi:ADP-heptose:LPS heptosyltransferase
VKGQLTGRYLIHGRLPLFALRAVDSVLDRLTPSVTRPVPRNPRRVLLAMSGHLGDSIIGTSAVSFTRRLLPDAEIGVVVPSWSRHVIDGNHLVARVHTLDHWILNRSRDGLPKKVSRYLGTWRAAVGDIRDASYDLAIDLYPYYPNSALLLKSAGVPVRVGYSSGGFGACYTHTVSFVEDFLHGTERQARLIAQALDRHDVIAGGNGTSTTASGASMPLRYELPPMDQAARERAREILRDSGVDPEGYVIVHMGAATAEREWLPEYWREVIRALTERGYRVICTGKGEREDAMAREVTGALAHGRADGRGAADLSGRFTWPELVAVIASARALLSVDTGVAHVAAAFGVQTVTLMATIAIVEHWRPYHERGTVLSHPMPCAPCFRRGGCAAMSCLRLVSPAQVVAALESGVDR